jgi:hypothetical protein
MTKDYEIRVYTLAGSFIQTIPRQSIKSQISFTLGINSWPGEISVSLNEDFSYTTIQKNSVMRVFQFDDINTNGRNIYTGIIQKITREMKSGIESITLSAIGIQVLFANLYVNQSGYTFTMTGEPKTLLQNIITQLNASYTGSWITYDASSMDTFGSNLSIDIKYTYCMDIIKKIIDATGWYFFVDGSGKFYFKPKPTISNLRLTFQKDIEEISVVEDSERIVNRHILTYKTGTITTNDTASQSLNGIRELYEEKTDIADLATANAYSASILQNLAVQKRKTAITINSSIDLETIKPGDALKVLNLDYTLSELLIQKVSYTPQKATLELENIRNFILELKS